MTAPKENDGWLGNYWNPANFTYEVQIDNAMEDIVVTRGNFRGVDFLNFL